MKELIHFLKDSGLLSMMGYLALVNVTLTGFLWWIKPRCTECNTKMKSIYPMHSGMSEVIHVCTNCGKVQ
jgi:hypothetical protein